jgi:hypothetical protein
MTEVIAAVPEKDDGSALAHVVPVSAPGVRLRRFVPDSPLEGSGFEPSVHFDDCRARASKSKIARELWARLPGGYFSHGGTEISNLLSS